MENGLLAAARRFPAQQGAIETLAARDETFRSLCADFAEAEAALARWQAPSSPVRERRRAEYQSLVEDLAEEIAATLGVGRRSDP